MHAMSIINLAEIHQIIIRIDRSSEVQKVGGSSVTPSQHIATWRQKIFHRSHSSATSTYGPHRHRPRARRADRTAVTVAAVLPPVETAPTGKKSAGGPPRTAAVAPTPLSPSRRFFWWLPKFTMPDPEYIKGIYQNTSWIQISPPFRSISFCVERVRTQPSCTGCSKIRSKLFRSNSRHSRRIRTRFYGGHSNVDS